MGISDSIAGNKTTKTAIVAPLQSYANAVTNFFLMKENYRPNNLQRRLEKKQQ